MNAPMAVQHRLVDMLPGIVAALSFSATDILLKLAYNDGMDVLSLATLRGVLVVALFWVWLKVQRPYLWHTPRQRNIALILGLLFAGVMFGLLLSVSLLPVSIAILAYFVYPLLTGIGAVITGVEKLGWRALITAVAAFGGLGLMLGVDVSTLSTMGLACAFGAAIFRVVSLLATRAYLAGTDARVTTWYSLVPSTAVFVVASALFGIWHLPHTHVGWLSFIGISFGSTLSTLLIYISTNRVGPFRTAFVMNLEPLVTAILSTVLLGEIMAPLQMLGAAVMIGALCVFQFMRGK